MISWTLIRYNATSTLSLEKNQIFKSNLSHIQARFNLRQIQKCYLPTGLASKFMQIQMMMIQRE